MSKNPSKYADVHPGAYDLYAWGGRPKGNLAYTLENHVEVWKIFQREEFWDWRLAQ